MTGVRQMVVDTSAVVDAVDARFPDRGEAFRYLQGSFPTQAPPLLAAEAGNVVHAKHPDAFGDTASERAAVVEELLAGIEIVETPRRSRERCGELVEEAGLTFYDAQFLELAERDDRSLLLTQDADLLDVAKDLLGDERATDLDEAGEWIASGDL